MESFCIIPILYFRLVAYRHHYVVKEVVKLQFFFPELTNWPQEGTKDHIRVCYYFITVRLYILLFWAHALAKNAHFCLISNLMTIICSRHSQLHHVCVLIVLF